MPRPTERRHRPKIRRIGVRETRWQRRWTATVDWLGARKPLNLILGAVAVIAAISLLAHLG